MRSTLAAVAAAALLASAGCGRGAPGAVGAGKAEAQRPNARRADEARRPEDTFSLSVPRLSTKVRQGGSKEFTVGVRPGERFDHDVGLTFDGLPRGVTVEPAQPIVKHGDGGVRLTFRAAAGAAAGDFAVKVTGHPQVGEDATAELKLTVEKK
jgi:hypothetical protein